MNASSSALSYSAYSSPSVKREMVSAFKLAESDVQSAANRLANLRHKEQKLQSETQKRQNHCIRKIHSKQKVMEQQLLKSQRTSQSTESEKLLTSKLRAERLNRQRKIKQQQQERLEKARINAQKIKNESRKCDEIKLKSKSEAAEIARKKKEKVEKEKLDFKNKLLEEQQRQELIQIAYNVEEINRLDLEREELSSSCRVLESEANEISDRINHNLGLCESLSI
ncbi:hypothetical protein P9112_000108 [Eukaryota sp. TZLM1-RC]